VISKYLLELLKKKKKEREDKKMGKTSLPWAVSSIKNLRLGRAPTPKSRKRIFRGPNRTPEMRDDRTEVIDTRSPRGRPPWTRYHQKKGSEDYLKGGGLKK